MDILALGIGPEWWVILVVILVLFGGKKIPELLRGVGKGVGELQKGLEEGRNTVQNVVETEAEKARTAKPEA